MVTSVMLFRTHILYCPREYQDENFNMKTHLETCCAAAQSEVFVLGFIWPEGEGVPDSMSTWQVATTQLGQCSSHRGTLKGSPIREDAV